MPPARRTGPHDLRCVTDESTSLSSFLKPHLQHESCRACGPPVWITLTRPPEGDARLVRWPAAVSMPHRPPLRSALHGRRGPSLARAARSPGGPRALASSHSHWQLGWRHNGGGRGQSPKSPMPRHRGGLSRSRPNRDSGTPNLRPNRDSQFPEIAPKPNSIQFRENLPKNAAARTVIAHCQRQARLLRFLVGVPGWEKRLIVQ